MASSSWNSSSSKGAWDSPRPSKTVAPSDAVQASKRKERSASTRSYKRARTTATATVEDPSGSEMLFMIYVGYGLTINAVDQNGALIPRYCIKADVCSVPIYIGLTVIGSDLHMFGGTLGGKSSIDTYTLDLHRIPEALEHGRGILELCVRDPHQMIDHKTTPIVYYARGRIYVISCCIDVQMPIRADCIRDGQMPGRDIEYRPFPFKPDAPWSGLDRPPIPPELGPVSIEAHALSGDRCIAISLTKNRGAYVLSLESHTWIPLETGPLCFTNQPALLPASRRIYISPSKSKLRVFDDILSSPIRKLRIRGTSRCIRHTTTHQVAIMGDVVFIIRCGSTQRSERSGSRAAYMTIDTYEVSPSGDRITELLCPPKLLLDAFHPRGPIDNLHCFPVRLSG